MAPRAAQATSEYAEFGSKGGKQMDERLTAILDQLTIGDSAPAGTKEGDDLLDLLDSVS